MTRRVFGRGTLRIRAASWLLVADEYSNRSREEWFMRLFNGIVRSEFRAASNPDPRGPLRCDLDVIDIRNTPLLYPRCSSTKLELQEFVPVSLPTRFEYVKIHVIKSMILHVVAGHCCIIEGLAFVRLAISLSRYLAIRGPRGCGRSSIFDSKVLDEQRLSPCYM